MVNSNSELLWQELKWQGEDIWCTSCVFTEFLLKLSVTIFSSWETSREIPCLHHPGYLAAVNNTCQIKDSKRPNTSSNVCVYALCVSAVIFCTVAVQSLGSQLTVIQRCGSDFCRARLYARLAGHMETRAKHPEGPLGVKTVHGAVPAK